MSIMDKVVSELETQVDRRAEIMDLLAETAHPQVWELIIELNSLTWEVAWKFGFETSKVYQHKEN